MQCADKRRTRGLGLDVSAIDNGSVFLSSKIYFLVVVVVVVVIQRLYNTKIAPFSCLGLGGAKAHLLHPFR